MADWDEVVACWADPSAHDAYLNAAAAEGRLDQAARHYREVADRTGDPVARERLRQVALRATFMEPAIADRRADQWLWRRIGPPLALLVLLGFPLAAPLEDRVAVRCARTFMRPHGFCNAVELVEAHRPWVIALMVGLSGWSAWVYWHWRRARDA
jgi:hypothetical protein